MLELESIKTVVSLLAIVSCILILCVLWTKFGRMKGFKFLTGEFCMITAIACGFQGVLYPSGFTFTMMVFWFLSSSIIFAVAIWYEGE